MHSPSPSSIATDRPSTGSSPASVSASYREAPHNTFFLQRVGPQTAPPPRPNPKRPLGRGARAPPSSTLCRHFRIRHTAGTGAWSRPPRPRSNAPRGAGDLQAMTRAGSLPPTTMTTFCISPGRRSPPVRPRRRPQEIMPPAAHTPSCAPPKLPARCSPHPQRRWGSRNLQDAIPSRRLRPCSSSQRGRIRRASRWPQQTVPNQGGHRQPRRRLPGEHLHWGRRGRRGSHAPNRKCRGEGGAPPQRRGPLGTRRTAWAAEGTTAVRRDERSAALREWRRSFAERRDGADSGHR